MSSPASPKRAGSPFDPTYDRHPFSEFAFLDHSCRSFAVSISNGKTTPQPAPTSPGKPGKSGVDLGSSEAERVSPSAVMRIVSVEPGNARNACDNKDCIEAARLLQRTRANGAAERFRLHAEVEELSQQLQTYVADAAPLKRELDALLAEGGELARAIADAQYRVGALRSKEQRQSHLETQASARLDSRGTARVVWAAVLASSEQKLSDLRWSRGSAPAIEEAPAAPVESEEVLFGAVGMVRASEEEELRSDYLGLAHTRLIDLRELIHVRPCSSSLPPLPLKSASRRPRTAPEPFRMSVEDMTFGSRSTTSRRSLPGIGGSRFRTSTASTSTSSSSDSLLNPIFYDRRAQRAWGRSQKLGVVRECMRRTSPLRTVPHPDC